jgi:hypothetical protein
MDTKLGILDNCAVRQWDIILKAIFTGVMPIFNFFYFFLRKK